MVRNSSARRVILVLAALVFLGIGVASLVDPHAMASGIGLRLEGKDGLSEFRAIYVGLWTATALVLILGALRVQDALIGDLAALLIGGQVAGRLVSVVLDGFPSEKILPVFILETLGACALFVVRPSSAETGEDSISGGRAASPGSV